MANDRVGLCIDRGLEMIVGLLAILKAGAAYVPLNPEHPRERLELQLSESNAAVLVTAAGSIDGALTFKGETIDLKLHRGWLDNEPATNPPRKATPGELAYVIYTSGSTGIPKGVAVSHANLANYTQFILQRLSVSGPLHFASVSTISADLGNTCIFPSLLSGGCLHLLSYEVAMSGELFSEYTSKHPIDVLKIVPSHLNALLSAETQGQFLPSQYLISGGEALSWELVQRIARLKPTCRIINHYGPTETTVGSLTCDVEADLVSPYAATVPLGRPIANTKVYVLDRYQQPTPNGVAGELFIGGAGVARGYLNQVAETASKFLADPFSDEPGARVYRTGDLVRYLPDGKLEFLGRADHQVKIRGFRVELAEIEAVLTSHANIQQAVVVARKDHESQGTTSEQRLVAYLLSVTTKPPAADELRQLLRLKLPEHMVPAAFVFLKSMPLTANGKIDRAALPAPDDLRPELKKIFVAPRTAIELELARIWSSLLKISDVGVHDNFFDLGGHSLLATQVVSRMRQSFKVEISLRSLFETPTIAALAQQIETASATETARLLAELEALSEEEAELLLKQEKSARNQSD
jgi:amino acid adenylation domain-containing protein